MSDNRTAERVPFPYDLDQFISSPEDYSDPSGGDIYIHAVGVDISTGGMAAQSLSSVDPLSRAYVMFTLPRSRTIRCDCYVTHSQSEDGRCLFGLRFLGLSDEDKAAIEAYIASCR